MDCSLCGEEIVDKKRETEYYLDNKRVHKKCLDKHWKEDVCLED